MCAQVTGASSLSSVRVCQRLLGSLVRLTSAAQNVESQELGLRALLCLVSATREAVIHSMPGQQAGAESLHASAGSLHQNGHADVSASSQPGTSASSQLGSREGSGWNRDSLLAGKGAEVLQLALRSAAGQAQAQHAAAAYSEGDLSAVESAEGGPKDASMKQETKMQAHGADHRRIQLLQLQVHFLVLQCWHIDVLRLGQERVVCCPSACMVSHMHPYLKYYFLAPTPDG